MNLKNLRIRLADLPQSLVVDASELLCCLAFGGFEAFKLGVSVLNFPAFNLNLLLFKNIKPANSNSTVNTLSMKFFHRFKSFPDIDIIIYAIFVTIEILFIIV